MTTPTDEQLAAAHAFSKRIVPACVPLTDDGAWEHSEYCNAIAQLLANRDAAAERRGLNRALAIVVSEHGWIAASRDIEQAIELTKLETTNE